MLLLPVLILSLAVPTCPKTPLAIPVTEMALPQQITALNWDEDIAPIIRSFVDSSLYFGAGILFGSAACLGGIGWAVCQASPWASTTGNEFLLSSRIFGLASMRCLTQMVKKFPFVSLLFPSLPSSYSAWEVNHQMLSKAPVSSFQDQQLVQFLQRRWLAKMTGCYPFLVDWMCPSFGISFQVHPETTNCYARDPATKYSDTYQNRVKAWKYFLPQPEHFPLVLTRPENIDDYLPCCYALSGNEPISESIERLAKSAHPTANAPLIVDMTERFAQNTDREQWLAAWNAYERQFRQECTAKELNPNDILCIQRIEQQGIGGIRLLPFSSWSEEHIEHQHQFLLEWISRFGLTANRIELDRPVFPSEIPQQTETLPIEWEFTSKEQYIECLDSIGQQWNSAHPQKTLMIQGTLQVLKDLCLAISQKQWETVFDSPTQAFAVQLSLKKIKQQFYFLLQEGEKNSFHQVASRVEQIHADLTSLLEIFKPYHATDFISAFKNYLTVIPESLRPLTRYALHASAMTSLAGIFKAQEKTIGRSPRILFGENTYFECIHASERASNPVSIQEATEQDWKEVDLILAQFNPTVKRINFKVTEYQATEYHVEKIADILHKALKLREGKPLTVAVDGTLDYGNSQRIGQLLEEFQQEIAKGELNFICYRSGLKFDLFGMDNYCGAPFFMIHNQDPKWTFFDALLSDPVLQTDHLSLNWFCLAYQHATPYLEAYRKHIFENTRAVLNRIPSRLFDENHVNYRVIPVDSDVDPSFLDIKIFGPFHAFRGELLVGILFTLKSMQAGYPLLFRPGIGFYHPNLAVLFGKECTTVRLTIGLDPAQVDVIVQCLEKINACNGVRS
jgi:hypothetical protein